MSETANSSGAEPGTQAADQPLPAGPDFLAVGRLRRPHGVHGEVVMDVMTDFPERLHRGVVVYLGDERRPLKIRTRRTHQQALLLSFEEYHDADAVGELRNQLLYVPAADRPPLPEGEYYHHQMIGLRVVNEDGTLLGILTQILDTGANDVYVVTRERGPEVLLPATEEVILAVDLDQGHVKVHLLPGLLPE